MSRSTTFLNQEKYPLDQVIKCKSSKSLNQTIFLDQIRKCLDQAIFLDQVMKHLDQVIICRDQIKTV